MCTYSHYIFSSAATLSCCVQVCKNIRTCTVFNAKSSFYECEYVFACVCSNSSLKLLSQLKTKFTWDHHGIGANIYSSNAGQLLFLFEFCQLPGAGAFSGDFTTNLARQCRAFSRALKIEKLKAPLFRGPEGAGLQMTGA